MIQKIACMLTLFLLFNTLGTLQSFDLVKKIGVMLQKNRLTARYYKVAEDRLCRDKKKLKDENQQSILNHIRAQKFTKLRNDQRLMDELRNCPWFFIVQVTSTEQVDSGEAFLRFCISDVASYGEITQNFKSESGLSLQEFVELTDNVVLTEWFERHERLQQIEPIKYPSRENAKDMSSLG